jgi:cytochrome c2
MVKVPITVQLVLLTVGLTGIYTMVGQTVPQKEVHPPEVIEISKDVSPMEMAEIGKGIFEGKGICNTCHTIGKSGALRYPDLDGMSTRAATRIPGYSAVDYLAETFYEPDTFLVEGFTSGMPTLNKPPIGLTDDEILTLMAYVQTLGGTPTVTMETKHAFNGGTSGGDGEAAVAEGEGDAGSDGAAADGGILAAKGCTSCHSPAAGGDTLKGPSLHDAGTRLGRDELTAGLIFHPGEDGLDQVTQDDIKALVAAMTELRGEG